MCFLKENNEYYVVDWEHWPDLKKELADKNYQWSGNTPIYLTDDVPKHVDKTETFVIRVYDFENKLICKSVLESLTQDELEEAVYCLDEKTANWLKRKWIKTKKENKDDTK